MEPAKFTFIPLEEKKSLLDDSKNLNKIMQWSFKGTLQLKFYNFNQELHPYQIKEFIEAFFRDPAVYSSLEVFDSGWHPLGAPAKKVKYDLIASTVTSMSFFDRLLDPKNNIVRCNGEIRQCIEEKCKGFYIEDKLMEMFLMEDSSDYNLYSGSERNEFIFNLLKHIYLGGEWCQRDFTIEPYMKFTKDLYKELMSVERAEGSTKIRIRSAVFKVIAYEENEKPICPVLDPLHLQNFVYLIVDPFKRQLSVLMNHFAGNTE